MTRIYPLTPGITQAYTREINRLYRLQDELHKWPIRGRSDATERAIRRCTAISRQTGVAYCAHDVDAALPEIVNKEA